MSIIVPNSIKSALEFFKPKLMKAVSRSNEGWDWDMLSAKVDSGELGFFHNNDSCAIMQMCTCPAGVYLHCLFAAGTQDGLYSLYEDVAKFAKNNGCYKMTTLARKGFTRRLPKAGWKQPYAFFERAL